MHMYGEIYFYDSLQLRQIHPDVKIQMRHLYGTTKQVKRPYVQKQRGLKDCGCVAVAFCVSLIYGEDPSTLIYQQEALREHIINSFTQEHFLPFPAETKKTKHLTPPLELSLE